MEAHLRHEPTKQFRLRLDDIRVFYDVRKRSVEVLAIVFKDRADEWLSKVGEQS